MPRAGLTPDIVAAEAARVADEFGLERLTLAAVAERFGVAVPSLYKHVAGLEGLRRSVAVLGVRELGARLTQAMDRATDEEGLRSMGQAYRQFALEHPGRYAATLRAPDPDDQEASEVTQEVLATVLSVLARYGLTGPDAIDATRALRSALHGFVALEAVGGFGIPQDVDRSFSRLLDLLEAALRTWEPAKATS